MKGQDNQKPTSFYNEEVQETQPGIEKEMKIKPEYIRSGYKGSSKLEGKVALITGGDSGIGRSVAVHFAREGANIAIAFKPEEKQDANDTLQLIQNEGRRGLLLPGDLRDKNYCEEIIEKTVKEFGKLNILVNNAAVQYPKSNLEDITDEQLEETFDVNILSFFRVTRAAMKHLHEGDSIINTTSINAYRGHLELLDYTATKGAITAFTRALSSQLAQKKIRVNAVAPGPIWTPLIVSTFPEEKIKTFGHNTPLKRAGQPSECGPSYVFLASEDSTYITGQCLHPNGGNPLNT
jgi:NAD(P)-dependent dehydrogenase (short-subunit alcohol dehydrogenase family)